jgi:hypothetical protein
MFLLTDKGFKCLKNPRKMPAAPFQVVCQEGDKNGRGEILVYTCFFLLMKNLRIYDCRIGTPKMFADSRFAN